MQKISDLVLTYDGLYVLRGTSRREVIRRANQKMPERMRRGFAAREIRKHIYSRLLEVHDARQAGKDWRVIK